MSTKPGPQVRYALPTPACYVPLFALTPGSPTEPFRHHGTGTLMIYRQRPLLVTAAHVVEDAPHGLAVMLTRDGLMKKVNEKKSELLNGGEFARLRTTFRKTAIPEGKTRGDDWLDVAATALDIETAVHITFGPIGYMMVPEILPAELKPGVRVKLAGYPEWTTEGQPKVYHLAEGSAATLYPLCLNSKLVPEEEYPAGVPREHCVIADNMREDRTEAVRSEAAFSPGGMSGGPMFLDCDNTRLVGIATNWGRKAGCVYATKLTSVTDVLDAAVAD